MCAPTHSDVFSIQCVSPIRFVLIVEKETVFRQLVHHEVTRRYGCVLLTVRAALSSSSELLSTEKPFQGKGYPAVADRQLVAQLRKVLPSSIPFGCIVDADPYGFDIFLRWFQAIEVRIGGDRSQPELYLTLSRYIHRNTQATSFVLPCNGWVSAWQRCCIILLPETRPLHFLPLQCRGSRRCSVIQRS